MQGIRCKSYTLPGIDGGEITIAETIDRQSIRVTAIGKILESVTLFITAEQFEALCDFGSLYDGLEVKKSAPSEEGAIVLVPVAGPEPAPELGEIQLSAG